MYMSIPREAWPITWRSRTQYVDIDTGEEITKHQSKKYIKIKTDRYVKLNYTRTRGTIEYIVRVRKNPQGTIF